MRSGPARCQLLLTLGVRLVTCRAPGHALRVARDVRAGGTRAALVEATSGNPAASPSNSDGAAIHASTGCHRPCAAARVVRDEHEGCPVTRKGAHQRVAHLEVRGDWSAVEQHEVQALAHQQRARVAISRRRTTARRVRRRSLAEVEVTELQPRSSPRGSRSSSLGEMRERCQRRRRLLELMLRKSSRSTGRAPRRGVRRGGASSPTSVFTSVDLPAPLGPSRPTRALDAATTASLSTRRPS